MNCSGIESPVGAPLATKLSNERCRIYGKHQSQRRFRPMNLNNGSRVVNLIFATILTAAEAQQFMEREAPRNPEWQFVVRRIEDYSQLAPQTALQCARESNHGFNTEAGHS